MEPWRIGGHRGAQHCRRSSSCYGLCLGGVYPAQHHYLRFPSLKPLLLRLIFFFLVLSTYPPFFHSHCMRYQIAVTSSLAANGLTKIITIEPQLMLVNRTRSKVIIKEAAQGASPILLTPGAEVPWWPRIASRLSCRWNQAQSFLFPP